jgi:hypothetical protein
MDDKKPICGVIMPISFIDGCSEAHWQEVLQIVSRSIIKSDFEPNLVSSADEIGFIHKRIIQNLYDNPVVVCDVSGKNSNVMFELGMRLAFDKPTVIIKDDKTTYSFDTSPIEHLTYPRDLRFSQIEDFQSRLSEKIKATYEKSKSDPNYTAFLGHFGEFTVQSINEREVSPQEFISESLLDEMRSIKRSVRSLEMSQRINSVAERSFSICMAKKDLMQVEEAIEEIRKIPGTTRVNLEERSKNHFHIRVMYDKSSLVSPAKIRSMFGSPTPFHYDENNSSINDGEL